MKKYLSPEITKFELNLEEILEDSESKIVRGDSETEVILYGMKIFK